MVKFSIYLNRRVFVMTDVNQLLIHDASLKNACCLQVKLGTRYSTEQNRIIFSTPSYTEGGLYSRENFGTITKTRLYNFDPLKPHFYIVKLGFTGVYIIFLISAENIDSGYSLEPPLRGGSNEYPQSMF